MSLNALQQKPDPVEYFATDETSIAGELDLAISRVISSRAAEESEDRLAQLISLGSVAVGAALLRLSTIQAPDIVDILVRFLANWTTIDRMLDVAQNRNAPWSQRVAAIETLALQGPQAQPKYRAQVGTVLADLAKKDLDLNVRFAAIEAVGSAQPLDAQLQAILREIAEDDPSPSVSGAAQQLLDSSGE